MRAPVEKVLGIDLPPSLWDKWWTWLAPSSQPFIVSSKEQGATFTARTDSLTPQQRHTFKLWRADLSEAKVVWIDATDFDELSPSRRASLVRTQVTRRRGAVPSVRGWSDVLDPTTLRVQADGHRFLWWPAVAAGRSRKDVLRRRVDRNQLPSRHHEVDGGVWSRCSSLLPGVRMLAGTFAEVGEPNCFAAVMTAQGVDEVADACVLREHFERWLAAMTSRVRDGDELPGTVLVWRNGAGELEHAAVTIGSGWALEKASVEWWRPNVVLSVRDLIRSKHFPGWHLERHSMR